MMSRRKQSPLHRIRQDSPGCLACREGTLELSFGGQSEMVEDQTPPNLMDSRPHFLDPELRGLIRDMDRFTPLSVPYGATIIQEGETADALYLLSAGRARVVRQDKNGREKTLNMLHPGNLFGEVGLLQDGKRTATVRACDNVLALRLESSLFSELLCQQPEVQGYFERHIQRLDLQDFLRLQSPFSQMPFEVLAIMLNEFRLNRVEKGQLIIRQGDDSGPVYLVQEGHLRVCVEKDGRRAYTRDLRPGDVFGELAVVRGVKRTASVEALSAGTLLSLRPETCWRLLNTYPAFKWQIETIMCWHGWVPP